MNKEPSDTNLSRIYLVIPPGLEKLAEKEFQEKWSLLFDKEPPLTKSSDGGISIEVDILDIEYLTHYLKIPTRVLLRLGQEFKVRDFPKLFTKLKSATWMKDFLVETPQQIKCTSKKSRLLHTKKLEDTVRKALEELFKNNPPKKKIYEKTLDYAPSVLHIRIENDFCQMSLDVTGGNLFKRGERVLIGEAPLRENIAAAFMYFSESHLKKTLCDPMCGSGALLIEAHSFYKPISRSQTSFLTMPSFIKKSHNLIELKEELKSTELKSYGFDLCEKTLAAAKANNKYSELFINDIWTSWPLTEPVEQMILNPPWNKRIKLDKENKRTHIDLFEMLVSKKSKNIAMILPKEVKLDLFSIPPTKKLFLSSGGINIQFLYWER
jgi:putative N6-adenine-specific DNA methylase